ncbi:plasmid stabilization protein [Pseudomonas sp. SK3(2021)]|uniref:plasmid replication initiator TrfA n=1 Tax=Pseudomonas sp. SK3(2021) TaxID=2841064 RepID=UPI00192C2ECF|nr:plasmid replication initiator TrfA [Pseudomonas sp. SK3(2021)]QQZ41140.1 plasmid stabilization protein [Pseudomonas sp. SK3(2021)]
MSDEHRAHPASPLARLEQIRRVLPGKAPVGRVPKQLFLPGLSELYRAMPNHIARSSLFAPVARGAKMMHKETVLFSRRDAVITFWGEQLDEAQADVWMQVMHEAIKLPLGDPVPINRASLLRTIGRQTGNYEYQWLHRTMKALTFAMLIVEATKQGKPKLEVGRAESLHMLDRFAYDPSRECYMVYIDPKWRLLYGNREFALIDWEKRLRIRKGQDMAKAIQRLVATSDEAVQRFPLVWLKQRLQYFSPMRKFRKSLQVAMQELERVEVIVAGRIEVNTKGEEQAVWGRL